MYKKFPIQLGMLFTLALLARLLPAQEFSADVITHTLTGQVSKSKLYSTANKQRLDSSLKMPGGKVMESYMIVDRDAKLIYMWNLNKGRFS